MISTTPLRSYDPEIFDLVRKEANRQEFNLEMIPSENFVSESILTAMGSVLTNKYAEGLPGKRYYGGCENVDVVETIAIERAKKLFGCEAVNVQSHSGGGMNQAVFEAVLNIGDPVMGMRLDQGGHLTHGSPVNFSGKHYKVVAYGVREDNHLIDPDEVRKLALGYRPKMIICGATAYSRQIDFSMFRRVADEIGAVLMCDISHYSGLVAGGAYDSPIPHCDIVSSTTHKTLRGPRSGFVMCRKNFEKAVNKAVFPGLQGGPHMHTIAAKAVAFKEAMEPSFKQYARSVVENARALAAAIASTGLKVVSGGTDSHLMLVDLRPMSITGKEAEAILGQVGITVNKNTIPYDPESPMVTSGIRLGTPALTTRGMGVDAMKNIGRFIFEAIHARSDTKKLASLREDVVSLCKNYPLYPKERLE